MVTAVVEEEEEKKETAIQAKLFENLAMTLVQLGRNLSCLVVPLTRETSEETPFV